LSANILGDSSRSSFWAPVAAEFPYGKDLAAGHGEANLPGALSRKYPKAGKEWAWQYVFPSTIISPDREDGTLHFMRCI
jgi:hypothetical protein